MTVKELIELNQMITDVEIEIRDNHKLVDILLYGCAVGVKPRFPRKVPESPQFVGNTTRQKEAIYIPKSINSFDDGRDYWQVKTDRLPKGWKDLTVERWEVWPASCVGTTSPRRMNLPNPDKEVKRQEPEIQGQTSIFDFLDEEGETWN